MAINMKELKIKTIQFAVGIDLLGSKMTLLATKNNDLEITPMGVIAHSKTSDRYVLIPFPNLKAIEFVKIQEK